MPNQNGYSKVDNDQPPITPTPDYDSTPSNTLNNRVKCNGEIVSNKGTMGRVAASEIAKANGAAAELESIESFKLTNPSSPTPKPPPIYWAPQNSGPPTMKKTQRQVSVTIGEYGNFNNRKAPSKFDFINSKSSSEYSNCSNSGNSSGDDVSSQFRDELQKTLSRSNLKKRNDDDQSNKILNDSNYVKEIPKKLNLHKTQSNIENISTFLINHTNQMNSQNGGLGAENQINPPNKITISIPSTNSVIVNGNGVHYNEHNQSIPNGILKTNNITNIKTMNGNLINEHKNISFEN